MLAPAIKSIYNDDSVFFFFNIFNAHFFSLFFFLFGHSQSCVPLFCPTKTTKHFSPLAVSCSAQKNNTCADAVEDNTAFPKNLFLSLQTIFFTHFFCLLSSPVPLQKSPNNHFFDKVSTVLFSHLPLSPIFLTFLGFFSIFFDFLFFFFFRVWGKGKL